MSDLPQPAWNAQAPYPDNLARHPRGVAPVAQVERLT